TRCTMPTAVGRHTHGPVRSATQRGSICIHSVTRRESTGIRCPVRDTSDTPAARFAHAPSAAPSTSPRSGIRHSPDMSDRTYFGHLTRSVIAGAGFALLGLAAGATRFLIGGGSGISQMLSALRDSGPYVGALAAGGLAVGILFPLRHTKVGAAVVGAVAA